MNNIIQVNKDDMDVIVQPSVAWRDLNDELVKLGTGLFFPVDPGSFKQLRRPRFLPKFKALTFALVDS
ncbi:hypothetical protein TGAMA5MH_10853 [Trichoderma gamsii]|uniref:Uncharacterized protein n=1 Tax=Trichoderma gamsii TaxID=398673 RepID=A0A2K0SVK0_9HYPO|nr:hypothetical protein TGAMA5MH_10853 [Trichoderma gamsii]